MSLGDINRVEKLFQCMKMSNVFNYSIILKGKYQSKEIDERNKDILLSFSLFQVILKTILTRKH